MQVCLVLTVLGPDRPGVVQQVAALIRSHGGSWLESRMCRLGGEFAGILRCQLPVDGRAQLEAAVAQWAQSGFSVSLKTDPGHITPEGTEASLSLIGQDRPGIVEQITAALAHHEVNVEELETECASAPMSGQMLFRADIRVWIPEACQLTALREELERIAADLLVDIHLDPKDGTS